MHMQQSRRARRMERHHKRNKQPALNLVSLMDIFTILVFFLLVSSSNVQQLPNKKDIKLPTSIAEKAPKETLIIAVTGRDILVQGQRVVGVSTAIGLAGDLIPELAKELKFQAAGSRLGKKPKGGFAVTIMGDEALPYELLRKILATCRQSHYTKIAFAAVQKAKGKA